MSLHKFKKGDVLVLFGELFQRGYANGLVEEALAKEMLVIKSTVGRRDETHQLRPLNEEESKNFTAPWVNIPLECGFDLEPNTQGQTPVDLCKGIGLREGINGKLDLKGIEESHQRGKIRFRQQVKNWVQAIKTHIPEGSNILFAHLMAGGVPRSKIILSLMNRAFKGTGDRYLGSEDFWNSDLGALCKLSFQEVTAESFNVLIEETQELRSHFEKKGLSVGYSAYGYHGTKIYLQGQPEWMSYTPYLQGFAKLKLEDYAKRHANLGVKAVVYNCPEILTNSSGIFPGVEIFLYSILFEMRRRKINNPMATELLTKAEGCVTADNLAKMQIIIEDYLKNPTFRKTLIFDQWPMHSNKLLMELMLGVSDTLVQLHKDPNQLMTQHLSELVIKSSGKIILDDVLNSKDAVYWLGHDKVIEYFEGH